MTDDIIDRENPLDHFAPKPEGESMSMVPREAYTTFAPRYGAQQVAVKRNKASVLAELRVMAAAAGEDWYWRWQVNEKQPNGSYAKVWIDGPSIKCANNVAREYGNCYAGARLELDTGTHWRFVGLFMDFETGFAMERPFNQRKGQKAMGGDIARAEDMIYQIGVSKAIRNVVNNALESFVNYAKEEAKASIIDKVGKKLDFYKEKIAGRLKELKVDMGRVEIVRGRAFKDWLAADVTYTIAELQAIGDGMATPDETYPLPEAAAKQEATEQPKTLDEFAGNDNAGTASQGATNTAAPAGGGAAPATPSQGQAGAADAAKAAMKAGLAAAKESTAATASDLFVPTTEAQYVAYCNGWIAKATDADAVAKQWKDEKTLRNSAKVSGEARDELESAKDARIAQLKAKG
jgi:hypothetical protein